jgi:hypothetical protein
METFIHVVETQPDGLRVCCFLQKKTADRPLKVVVSPQACPDGDKFLILAVENYSHP